MAKFYVLLISKFNFYLTSGLWVALLAVLVFTRTSTQKIEMILETVLYGVVTSYL